MILVENCSLHKHAWTSQSFNRKMMVLDLMHNLISQQIFTFLFLFFVLKNKCGLDSSKEERETCFPLYVSGTFWGFKTILILQVLRRHDIDNASFYKQVNWSMY